LNCELAIEFFDKGYKYLLDSKSKLSYSTISINRYNKGNCFIQMSNYVEAKKNFELAISYAKRVNALSLHAFALKGLAQVYTLEGQFQKAIVTLQKANSISKNVKDLILIQEIYKGLSENYLALNEWERYKDYHFQYLKTQKLIKDRERKSISDSLNEKKSELALVLEKTRNRFYGWFALIFFIGLGLFFYLYRLIKALKKDILLLEQKIGSLQNSSTHDSIF